MRMGRVSFGKGIMPERMAWVITLGGVGRVGRLGSLIGEFWSFREREEERDCVWLGSHLLRRKDRCGVVRLTRLPKYLTWDRGPRG